MALRDLEAFVRQSAASFDPNLDTNPGSPFDSKVIQPLIRRVGPDPFSVDMQTFIDARLRQAYPDMAIGSGDAITDLLSKPASLLWDPIVREVTRVRRGLSFSDPNTLTTEEAEALGANLFANRSQGAFARGTARLFFAQAQNVSISPVNFLTSRTGLRFFPTESQAIRIEEMLQNVDTNGLFYFDITAIAEAAGAEYNLGPKEIASIANLDAAVQVSNLRKFEEGDDAQTAAEFVDQTEQSLTERSLVTIRGVAAKVTSAFPEVSRLNVVGFNDPEMQRDILSGGGLGPILAAGSAGASVSDLVGAPVTRRFSTAEVDFTTLIGPAGVVPSGFMLTVFGAFGTAAAARDLVVSKVISTTIIEVATQEMGYGLTGLRWSLRKSELTLSSIPGGILFPDSQLGTVTVPDGSIHIGGTVDTHIRGASFDEATLVIDNLTDDSNELEGLSFDFDAGDASRGTIDELVLGVDYVVGDETYQLLARAGRDSLTLQIVNGVNAGVYRILSVNQSGSSPVVTVTPNFTSAVAADARWRVFDNVDVALYDIKETRVQGDDLSTVQNFDVVTTASALDMDAVGVAEGDVLRILEGPDAGDYAVTENPLAPGFTSLRVDAVFTSSQSNLSYVIFRPNAGGNLQLPLVRLRSIELLDSSSQPVGTTIPYARPVDIQSNAFQNPARGVKYDLTDTLLGLVSQPEPGGGFLVGGTTLTLKYGANLASTVNVSFSPGPALALATVISEINAAVLAQAGEPTAAIQVGADRIGIRPFGAGGVVATAGSAASVTAFFGGADERHTSRDIRSATIDNAGGWAGVDPSIDLRTGLDIVQVLDGNQVGFVPGPFVVEGVTAPATVASTALQQATLTQVFSPEAGVRVQVGARSIGSVRLFFLDPTSFEVRAEEAFFELTTDSGLVRFTPDPTLDAQRIPAPPGGDKPHDGASADASTTFSSASQDFILSQIQAGDKLVVDFHPIAGAIVLSDPVSGLVDKTLIFSVDGSPDKTLVFIRDDVTLGVTEVSRQGVIDQINAAAGVDIAALTGSNTLEFDAESELVIRGVGTANSVILGGMAGTAVSFVGTDRRNTAPHKGEYTIASVNSQTAVTLTSVPTNLLGLYTTPYTRQQFKVFRAGVQRISTAQMKDQTAEAGLYYMDVELVSEGTGDLWNIGAGKQLTVTGFHSDGYSLTTEDSNLTFSAIERPRLSISKTILEDGVDDDPANATQIAGQNILITYDRSSLVEDVQNFSSSETERVVNSSPLVRHLIPHFVRFDSTYVGGSKEEVVVPEVEDYINKIAPAEAFESSDLQKIMSDAGATSISNPIDLIAIVHQVDRSIVATRSQDRLTTGRLAAFIPDLLNIKRNIT
jgi:hypothetical protein